MAANDCEHVEQEEIDYGRWGMAIRGGGNFASLATSPTIIDFTVVDFGWHMMGSAPDSDFVAAFVLSNACLAPVTKPSFCSIPNTFTLPSPVR